MKKISTVQTFKSEIFKEQQLTIGVDLGDRWSFLRVLDEAGKIILEQKVPTTPEAMKQTFSEDAAKSHRPGDRNTFAMGKPAVNGAGTRSDRGARTKSAIDHQEQSKDDRHDARHWHDWRASIPSFGAGAASQCTSANPSDGNPGAS